MAEKLLIGACFLIIIITLYALVGTIDKDAECAPFATNCADLVENPKRR